MKWTCPPVCPGPSLSRLSVCHPVCRCRNIRTLDRELRMHLRTIASLVVALAFSSSGALARPAGYFGFGPLPTYHDLLGDTQSWLRQTNSYVWFGDISLSHPVAACLKRGIGRRDVCGYRFCISKPNMQPVEIWKTHHYGFTANGNGQCGISITPWVGDPPIEFRDFCDLQPKQPDCVNGLKEPYATLSVAESIGAARLEREAAERKRKEAEEHEAARQQLEADRVEREAVIADARQRGPAAAYATIARLLYSSCRRYADTVFTTDLVDKVDIARLDRCAADSEASLLQEVKIALDGAKPAVAEQLKGLHAYTVASLRALENYRQSIIEARQDRSARMAQIDERAARLELEL